MNLKSNLLRFNLISELKKLPQVFYKNQRVCTVRELTYTAEQRVCTVRELTYTAEQILLHNLELPSSQTVIY